jgi:predicted tellurium resistance membrane protein TerC
MISLESLISLGALTAMETVLGIDNIIYIAILVGRLTKEAQIETRNLGIGLALVIRVLLIFSISWIMTLTSPLFTLFDHSFSGRDPILLGSSLFLFVSQLLRFTTRSKEILRAICMKQNNLVIRTS